MEKERNASKKKHATHINQMKGDRKERASE